MEQPTENAGGLGGKNAPGVRDVRLFERAVCQRWSIPPEAREIGPAQMLAVLKSDAKARTKTQAFRALIAADAANMEAERRDAGSDVLKVEVNTETTAFVSTLTPDDIREARRLVEEAFGGIP